MNSIFNEKSDGQLFTITIKEKTMEQKIGTFKKVALAAIDNPPLLKIFSNYQLIYPSIPEFELKCFIIQALIFAQTKPSDELMNAIDHGVQTACKWFNEGKIRVELEGEDCCCYKTGEI